MYIGTSFKLVFNSQVYKVLMNVFFSAPKSLLDTKQEVKEKKSDWY